MLRTVSKFEPQSVIVYNPVAVGVNKKKISGPAPPHVVVASFAAPVVENGMGAMGITEFGTTGTPTQKSEPPLKRFSLMGPGVG